MKKLLNKTAVITGSNGGIGKAIAHLFSNEGAKLGLLDIDPIEASSFAETLGETSSKHYGGEIDVSSENSIKNSFREVKNCIGPVDILINTAGIAGSGLVHELEADDWDKMFQVNLRGTFLCCKQVIPYMKEKKWGRIVNFSSEVAHRGNPGLSHYAASKAGIIAFSKCLALEVINDGICVNTLAPGPTDTAMLSSLDKTVIKKLIDDLMPIGRLGRPEEIAAAALFLSSEESAFCVGSTIAANGGSYLY